MIIGSCWMQAPHASFSCSDLYVCIMFVSLQICFGRTEEADIISPANVDRTEGAKVEDKMCLFLLNG